MNINRCAIGASIAALAATAPAFAGYPYGTGSPITVPTNNVTITLILDHRAAAWSGNLYFLGWGNASSVINPAPNTDATGLGTYIFNNLSAPVGTQVVLPGVFQAGQVLHFAYDIVAPTTATTDLLRTDVAGDQTQFAWDPENQFFAIEDTRPQNNSDLDFNDLVVGVCFSPVPAPGALALFGLATIAGGRRRRR